MNIRLISDLHSEWYRVKSFIGLIEDGQNDSETTLILAGDIFKMGNGKVINFLIEEFLDHLCARFKYVVMVTGNHEYYSGRIDKVDQYLIHYQDAVDNFHFLNGDWRILDDVVFVGGTLWTDFNKFNPMQMQDAKLVMNDYKAITIRQGNHYRKLRPNDTYEINKKHRRVISEILALHPDKKRVVVTHHLPSYESVALKHRKSYDWSINFSFFSDLDEMILDYQPDLWVHGHTHSSSDYKIGDTRVVANPMGYPDAYGDLENHQFNAQLIIEV